MIDSLDEKTLLNVAIRTREKEIYNGQCSTLSSQNEKGEFDILPFHANFITLFSGSILLDKGMPTEKRIEIEKGVLYNMSNQVSVYVGL